MEEEKKGYIFAAVLGVLGGSIVMALATKAIPKMMAGMMRNMMRHMQGRGRDPGML